MRSALQELRAILADVAALNAARALSSWDQETYMPPAGLQARARQLATLGRLAHERFTSPRVGELLQIAESETAELSPDSTDASLIRVGRRDYDKATRIPSDLVAELERQAALAQGSWKEARAQADFARFAPHLQRLVELNRRKAEALGYEESLYDALLDQYEPEMRSSRVRRLFDALRRELVPIVQAIACAPAPEDRFLHAEFDEAKQWDFGLRVIEDFGFDPDRGRQDRSAHPFTTSFSTGDVRITTRVQKDHLPSCLFGTLHEAGHAIYEQGIDVELEETPLAGGASLGIHESQSRLWENIVGRSWGFWSYYYPRLQRLFPAQLGNVGLDRFYQAVNRVQSSLIRVEADEVTYNLHIMLRFELEDAMLQGDLAINELPEAWNSAMSDYLGVVPRNDAEGVLQDIHWSLGAFGYFPTYTLGNLISAQLWTQAISEEPGIEGELEQGDFSTLLDWLRRRIHRHGRKFTAAELLVSVTGDELAADQYLSYIRNKFGELYDGLG